MNRALNNTQSLAPVFGSEDTGEDSPGESWRQRALQIMPGGVSANWRLAEGPDALVAARARGAHVWDVSNRKYLDYVCGLGTVLLGHADPDVNAAISAQLELGIQIAATHSREIQLAEELCAAMPGMDAVRFHINGTGAVQTALKIARTATSRETIIRFAGQHHGNQPLGPAVVLPWNDETALTAAVAAHGPDLAAILFETVMVRNGGHEIAPGFAALLRRLTTDNQSLLILNDSAIGLRLHFQGSIGKYLLVGNLTPDLVICSQALGNGAPICALAGKAKLMELLVSRAVGHSGTFNGNSIGIAAGLAVLGRLRFNGQTFHQKLHDRGHSLMQGLQAVAREMGVPLVARGPGPVFWVDLEDTPDPIPLIDMPHVETRRYGIFRRGLLKHGVRVLPGGLWQVGASHTDADVEFTIEQARLVLATIGDED